jgi:hypothetical protein
VEDVEDAGQLNCENNKSQVLSESVHFVSLTGKNLHLLGEVYKAHATLLGNDMKDKEWQKSLNLGR